MIPEKTGAVVWLEEYGAFVRGDSYRLGPYLLIRANNRSRTHGKPRESVHYIVRNTQKWFDEASPVGTIIADHFQYLGYEGETL